MSIYFIYLFGYCLLKILHNLTLTIKLTKLSETLFAWFEGLSFFLPFNEILFYEMTKQKIVFSAEFAITSEGMLYRILN